jgi:integrase/recombinase XerD
MSARSGQRGYLERKNGYWRIRFRVDEPGKFERKYRAVRLCPISGDGALSKTERLPKALEIISAEEANSAKRCQEAESATLTFREQAEAWLRQISTRKRKPIKPHTLTSWRSHLAWLNPRIEDAPLARINNLALRNLVSQMSEAGFKPKSMLNYLQVVKAVVASLVNDEGEPIYPRKWNHDFIDLPTVRDQHQPTLSQGEIEGLINDAPGWYRVLFCLLAGTGLRVGEALALQVSDLTGDVLWVRQNLYQRKLDTPKTAAGAREVDLAPELAELMRRYIGGRTSGFIFQTRKGGPIIQRNVLRMLHGILKRVGRSKLGFHAFRRFRVTHLRKNRVPEDLIKLWLGHAPQSVTDEYSKLKNDVQFRTDVVAKVGLGFEIEQQLHPVAPRIEASLPAQVVYNEPSALSSVG